MNTQCRQEDHCETSRTLDSSCDADEGVGEQTTLLPVPPPPPPEGKVGFELGINVTPRPQRIKLAPARLRRRRMAAVHRSHMLVQQQAPARRHRAAPRRLKSQPSASLGRAAEAVSSSRDESRALHGAKWRLGHVGAEPQTRCVSNSQALKGHANIRKRKTKRGEAEWLRQPQHKWPAKRGGWSNTGAIWSGAAAEGIACWPDSWPGVARWQARLTRQERIEFWVYLVRLLCSYWNVR